MKTGMWALAASAALLCVFVVLVYSPLSEGQNEADASFVAAKYNTKVHSYSSEVWNFTVHNANCFGNDGGEAQFFFNIYLDGSLWFDEYNGTVHRTWPCGVGKTVSHAYLKFWPETQPFTHDLRVELYWFYNGTSRLEDTLSFRTSVAVPVSLQHIIPTSYLAVYLMACALLLTYDYVASLAE
jgi:hypothetical protein